MNIFLICGGGFSTSILMKKITAEAEKRVLFIEVSAQGIDSRKLKGNLDKVDIILLAPQIRFYYDELVQITENYDILVLPIEPLSYGRMDAAKILDNTAEFRPF